MPAGPPAAGGAGSPANGGGDGAGIDIGAFRAALLDFFDAHARDLPWRRDGEPYRVWVSEIMLQQTRVETVIPYYERWMTRFPDLATLADADPDDVLRAWEGLGYYSRARNLQRAARVVRDRHAGEVPSDPAELRALPGIGDYTAGAISSIAFGHAEPAVDGNVRRVLARLTDDPAPAPATLRTRAAALVDPARPGDFNQAFMELGATLCLPRAPACSACPVHVHCRAYAHGTQAERPVPRRARPVPSFDVGTLLVTRGDEVLLERRPDTGLLAALWSFPGRVAGEGEPPEHAARRAAREVLGRRLDPLTPLDTLAHLFSHRREIYHVHRARLRGRHPALGSARWVPVSELARLTLPAAQRRIARLLGLEE